MRKRTKNSFVYLMIIMSLMMPGATAKADEMMLESLSGYTVGFNTLKDYTVEEEAISVSKQEEEESSESEKEEEEESSASERDEDLSTGSQEDNEPNLDSTENIVDKEITIDLEIKPDYMVTGSSEEYDQNTFHKFTLPYDRKEEGIVIAIPAPRKGRMHYYLGVDQDSARIIQPEVYEDENLTKPLVNHYESDEVYAFFYNFDVPEEGMYYLKLSAPEYDLNEDFTIHFSIQFYNGADRKLSEDIQAFCAVIDQTPVYYQIDVPEDGTIHVTADNYDLDIPTILTLCDEDKKEISDPVSRKEGDLVNVSFDVKEGTYFVKATDENDYYRISYRFTKATPVVETEVIDKVVELPKTGEDQSVVMKYMFGLIATNLAFALLYLSKKLK